MVKIWNHPKGRGEDGIELLEAGIAMLQSEGYDSDGEDATGAENCLGTEAADFQRIRDAIQCCREI